MKQQKAETLNHKQSRPISSGEESEEKRNSRKNTSIRRGSSPFCRSTRHRQVRAPTASRNFTRSVVASLDRSYFFASDLKMIGPALCLSPSLRALFLPSGSRCTPISHCFPRVVFVGFLYSNTNAQRRSSTPNLVPRKPFCLPQGRASGRRTIAPDRGNLQADYERLVTLQTKPANRLKL